MTCSFHKYGDGFFPGTGDVSEVGKGARRLDVWFPVMSTASQVNLHCSSEGLELIEASSCLLKASCAQIVQPLGVTGLASDCQNPMTMQRLL